MYKLAFIDRTRGSTHDLFTEAETSFVFTSGIAKLAHCRLLTQRVKFSARSHEN